MDGHPRIQVLIFVICFIFNFLLSLIVTAFEKVSEAKAQHDAEEGNAKAQKVLKLKERRHRFLTITDLFVLLFTGLMAVCFSYFLFKETGRELLLVFKILISICMAMLVEAFSIKLPKKIAAKNAEGIAYHLVDMVNFFNMIFTPLALPGEAIIAGLMRLFGVKNPDAEDAVTEEELISSVDEALDGGVLEEEEAEMIHNIFDFDEKQVKDIMTHRRVVTAIPSDTPIGEAMHIMLEHTYTRYPVYEESIENIIGILYIKDVMNYILNDAGDGNEHPVMEFAREPYFVPDTQNIDDLFHEMQRKKLQIAVAIDEYGQTAGIITMEDILEEIVGEIQDEYDDEEEAIVECKKDEWDVNGLITLSELADEIEITILSEDEESFDTLNGLLTSRLDHIPGEGDVGKEITYQGFVFTVVEVANKTVSQVHVVKVAAPEENEEE